eukprot:TRINITY_DN142_c0_g1_i2.p1 TRINITY_DN142_c0_g1~~TRINITY_DN142_c0_g1_i2.p1  ORF type:complete len:531 (-),score=125.42 TRINITY_DN142_c0_g1_i2:47-1639(-)
MVYSFGGQPQSIPWKIFSSTTTKGPVTVAVKLTDGTATVVLEPLDFIWSAPAVAPRSGDYRSGQKGAIVEFFGWPHDQVEAECQFLAQAGYLGAKLFPSQEQILSTQPFNSVLNPWYFMYQPVSYRLQGRMGSRDQLRSTIATCRSLGVRLYADAVINHMTGSGNDANPYHRNPQAGCSLWGGKNSSLAGGRSPMYTQGFVYTTNQRTGLPASQEFPAVPWSPVDFHCERALNSWTDPLDLNAGWLTGLVDLNTERDNVQERIAAYLTDLISIGFSGFRIDAAKHIKPDDLASIFGKVRRNLGGSFPPDFIAWLEVLLGGESDMLMCNPNSGYNYGAYLEQALSGNGLTKSEIDMIKIWNSGYPKETDKGVCTISPWRSAIQNDDADQQMPGSSSRDMGDQGCILVKGCQEDVHRGFEMKLFQSPNGATDNDNQFPIRLVLSSFYFPNDTALGIPDGQSDCSLCQTTCNGCQGVKKVTAFNAGSKGYDGQTGQVDYTRVHRDASIVNAMRQWIHLSPLTSKNNNNIISMR